MTSLRTVTGRELQWVRPRLFERAYELRSGDILIGEMKFERTFGWTALAKAEEGNWTLERRGFPKSRIIVCNRDTSAEVGSISERRGRRKQQVLLPDGSSYVIDSDFFRSQYSLGTGSGDPLVIMRRRGIFRITWEAEIRYRVRSNPDLPWLVMLLWFYILLARSRSRARGSA